jgi:hypothetical protein
MIKISIQDELGRLDLNQAVAPLLLGLLKSAGLDFDSATRLADKIVESLDLGDREIGSAHQPVMGRVRAWTSYDGGISKRLALNKDYVSSSG